MRRCDVKMWRWEDVKMWCEDVKMRRCDVKMRRCEDVRMWRREDVMRMWKCLTDPRYEKILEEPFVQTLSGKTCKSTSWSLIPLCVVILWISCLNFFYAFSGPRNPRKKAHRRGGKLWGSGVWVAEQRAFFCPGRRHLPCSAKAEGNHTTSANLLQ